MLHKGKQVVELAHVLDSVLFKTLWKEISLKLGFDKILYQRNMKCVNFSGKSRYMIRLCTKSLDLIIVLILHIILCWNT